MKNSNDTIWNPTSDLPICSAVHTHTHTHTHTHIYIYIYIYIYRLWILYIHSNNFLRNKCCCWLALAFYISGASISSQKSLPQLVASQRFTNYASPSLLFPFIFLLKFCGIAHIPFALSHSDFVFFNQSDIQSLYFLSHDRSIVSSEASYLQSAI
jgi:hypothetical protein